MSHRPHCGDPSDTPSVFFGGCFQHKRTDEAHVQFYENVTRVPDYHNPADPGGIAPYARQIDPNQFPSCAEGFDCGDGVNGLPFCDYWTTSSTYPCTSSATIETNVDGF